MVKINHKIISSETESKNVLEGSELEFQDKQDFDSMATESLWFNDKPQLWH